MSCKVPVAKVGPELDSAIIKGVNLIGAAAATERGEQEPGADTCCCTSLLSLNINSIQTYRSHSPLASLGWHSQALVTQWSLSPGSQL